MDRRTRGKRALARERRRGCRGELTLLMMAGYIGTMGGMLLLPPCREFSRYGTFQYVGVDHSRLTGVAHTDHRADRYESDLGSVT